MNHSFRNRFVLAILAAVMVLTGCAGLAAQEAMTQPVSQTADTAAVVATATTPVTADVVQAAPVEAPAVVGAPGDVLAQQQAFIDVYAKANPAVVHIGLQSGQGSGFVYDQAGYIVTNNHVVAAGGPILVAFADGSEKEARLVGTDPDSDLAVIQVEALPGELTAASLADSEALQVGQIVVAIGNPFGLEGSMTTGIISGLGRLLPSAVGPNGVRYNIPDVIQTDAAINPGNSGGPLLDISGRVIGVNSAIESPVRASSGIGYAVPSNIVRVVVPQLIENGYVAHPWLGISGTTLTAAIAQELGLDVNQRGVLVAAVTDGGPAAVAGLAGVNPDSGRSGDVITAIDGQPVEGFDQLLSYIVQHTRAGQLVNLNVLRNGQVQTVPLTLQARPASG